MAIRSAKEARIQRLYKFRTLSRRDRIEPIFCAQTLYWPAISELNDPFDSKPRIVTPPIRSVLDKRKVERSVFDLFRRHGMSHEEAKARSKAASLPGFLEERALEMTRQIPPAMEIYRIFSLAGNCRSILLWSHYAEAHTGICLGFSTHKTDFGEAMEVEYSQDLATLDLFDRAYETNLRAMVLTKSEEWRYEHEFRLVSEEPTPDGMITVLNHLYVFDSACLHEVIMGCNISPADEAFVREMVALSPSPIKLMRAVRSEHRFALDFIDA
jgi:hypothetical protein